ncbi:MULTISPECIES: VWA domain-containing protein [Shewanella]|uniref:VWA domain-containing protein n=1 Tax=Shewanella psychromarinicola TaxID=2487742 RepID=A0A3N4DP51_9GAMM|nr:VWA domain-containing protein [Shewanella psychromarinicola]AZG35607.1 VWA domain-containing protein [Shewanella psychromarinicola]MCL1081364.1 VWA domain-containing protein [Shewanella psychromarinicola]RPA27643.1 VWA domain-containing protein [Shewanella psychromarinicola]
MVHFIRPEWLIGFIPVVILSALFWRKHSQQSAWKQYIAPHLSQLLITQTVDKTHQPKWLLIACWMITVIALAGPALNKQSLPVFATEQGRVLIMDMSQSMYATDLSPNRLSYAKFRATDLLNELKEGETGLIAYAGDAYTISPLTRDSGTILNLLPTLSPDIMPTKGSNLAAALSLAEKLLAQGGHVSGDIIVMTDGISAQQYNQAKNALNGRYRLSIMAFGSKQGAPIRLADGQLLRDNSNEVVVTKTDYVLLQQLVQQHQGILVPAQTDGSDVTTLTHWLTSEGDATETELVGETWQDLGPYLAMLLIIPMLMSFRQGLLTLILNPLLLLGTLMSLSAVNSQPAQASIWQDLWKTQDQQAQSAFEQGEFTQAAETFENPQWQASAQYKAGNYQQALAGFEQDNSANGLYNQGNALMQLNNYQEAINRYQQALEVRSPFAEAQQNLELAKKRREQQKQSDQSNQDPSGDGQQSDDSNSDKSKQNSNSSSSEQSQSNQQNDEQNNQQSDEQKQNPSQNETGSDQAEPSQGKSEESTDQPSDPQQQQSDKQENSDNSQAAGEQANSEPSQSNSQSQQSDKKPSDDKSLSNEASMQAESGQAQNQPTEKQPLSASSTEESTTDKPASDSAEVVSASQMNQDDLPADMQRALRAINEDPQVLIRNKMQLEYQKRRQNSQPTKDNEQW